MLKTIFGVILAALLFVAYPWVFGQVLCWALVTTWFVLTVGLVANLFDI